MASVEWPSTITHLVIEGSLSAEPRDELARSDFDQGPGRDRQRFTQLLADVAISVGMRADEHEEFLEFFHVDLRNGSRWFRRQLPRSGGYIGFECRFTAKYQSSDWQNDGWMVGLNLEVRDFFLKRTPADLYAAYTWDPGNDDAPEDIIAATNLLRTFVHTTYPDICNGT